MRGFLFLTFFVGEVRSGAGKSQILFLYLCYGDYQPFDFFMDVTQCIKKITKNYDVTQLVELCFCACFASSLHHSSFPSSSLSNPPPPLPPRHP